MTYPDFFLENKINPALISDMGKHNVASIAVKLKQTSKLTSNQLRKFYDSFLRIFNSNLSDDEKKIQLLILKANSEYTASRLKTKAFAEFLNHRINLVLEQDQDFKKYLDALKIHFEALVAYFPKN